MTKLASVDASGNLLGFYDPAINKQIPSAAIALSDEQYQSWLANPNGLVWHVATAALVAAPAPVTPAPIVPMMVTAFQAKAALLAMPGAETGKTLLDDVNAWVAAGNALLQLTWAEAATITRSGPFVSQAAKKFGWSSAEIDTIFTAAAAITS